ncbi:hypothetical protein [Corallococcus macrosporus]|uniref:Uncharacterized protein n=1 Tax=Corallococcus macrosporus DSM 14697 TaxID=1189310 RepID=A0A250JTU2_9BACT|nr:hypothetical protein [Corallococcus macrosporus]ATB46791.1 hypothetical protein MYMAC_002396 [Corallococcus macrosporus DSM 14697]
MAKIDNMMGPNVRLSTNVTTARQTPDTGFGARLHNGLNSAASAVGTGVGAMAGMVPGGQIVSAAVSSMHTFSSTGGSGMGAPYAGVMNTAVGANLSGAVAPAGGGVVAGGGLGGAVAGSGSPLGLGAQGTGSTTDTVNGNFSLNKMAEENSKLLNLQAAIQQESQTFTAISNVMKSRNDTVKNSITNLR